MSNTPYRARSAIVHLNDQLAWANQYIEKNNKSAQDYRDRANRLDDETALIEKNCSEFEAAIGKLEEPSITINSTVTGVNDPKMVRKLAAETIKQSINTNGSHADPASVTLPKWMKDSIIRADTMKIDPGKIEIADATTLKEWRDGAEITSINGGYIPGNYELPNRLAETHTKRLIERLALALDMTVADITRLLDQGDK